MKDGTSSHQAFRLFTHAPTSLPEAEEENRMPESHVAPLAIAFSSGKLPSIPLLPDVQNAAIVFPAKS